jgi:hypothetical protein
MAIPSLAAQIQGQGTVSADNLNTFLQGAQMTSQLRTFTGLPGMTVVLQGVMEPNDGYGGMFYWNASGTEPDDNFNFIVPNGSGTGEWVRFGLEVTGAVNYSSYSVNSSVVAAGINQSTATLLSAQINNVTTVPSGSGVILPTFGLNNLPIAIGTPIKIFNRGGGNLLNVYPQTGFEIESLGVNTPSGIGNYGNATFTIISSNQWLVS